MRFAPADAGISDGQPVPHPSTVAATVITLDAACPMEPWATTFRYPARMRGL
jgi:hypothetical protein